MALLQLLLGLLAVAALFASDLPEGWAGYGALPVMACAAWAARAEWRKPWRTLDVPTAPVPGSAAGPDGGKVGAPGRAPSVTPRSGDDGRQEAGRAEEGRGELPPPCLDGVPLAVLDVRWRGRAVFLSCQGVDGRRLRTVLWPDVTTAHARRELRLALGDRAASPARPSMAP